MSVPGITIPFDRTELDGTIVARFAKVVATIPDRLALNDGKTRWTYEALEKRSDQIAGAIQLHGGKVAAYLVEHSADMVICALAALKAGQAYVCIHPRLPVAAQQQVIIDAAPAVLLVSAAQASAARGMAGDRCVVLPIDSIEAAPFTPPTIAPIDPAAIFYTSGSTGRPKGVVKNHRAVLHRAWLSAQHDGVGPGDRQSLLTYCSFASSEADVFGALLNGATIELFDPAAHAIDAFGQWIDARAITLLHPPVVLFRRFLATLEGSGLFPSVRLVALAGESVLASDIQAWRARFHPACALRHRFSSTEAGHIAVASIAPHETPTDGAIPPATPVADKHLLIVDETGQPVEAETAGELLVRSAFLADGYWRRDDSTRADFIDAPDHPGQRVFRTGDLGRLLPGGRFEFLGRRDGQVKVRGYRIELREIEEALAQLPGVKEAAVAADRRTDEVRLVAFVVRSSADSATSESLRSALQATLPAWKVPAEIRFVDSLPLTLTGKIDRPSLLSLPAVEVALPAPKDDADPVAAELMAMWEELFARRGIGLDDSFFDLGGHSLLAAQLMHRITLRLGRVLPISLLVSAPTIRQLATAVREARNGSSNGIGLSESVTLNAGSPDRPALFCFPPATGSAITYLPLARLLNAAQPVHVLQFRDDVPERDLEALAATFVVRLRRVWPRGPYRLCGYSYGGVLAFEVARQLVEAGERVDLLAMLDGRVPGERKPLPLVERWIAQLNAVRERGLRRNAKQLGAWLRACVGVKQSAEAAEGVEAGPTTAAEQARLELFRRYRPKRFSGVVTLFKAKEQPKFHRFFSPEPFNGWDAVCERVDTHPVPGAHLSILMQPNLAALARELDRCLAQDPHP